MKVQLKSAREMFEELGYEIVNEETSQDIPRKSWGGGLDDRFEIIYKRDEDLVLFEKDKSIATVQYGSGDDDDRIHYLSYGNSSLNLLQAINKQIEELGWDK